jgi:hypothetical protein
LTSKFTADVAPFPTKIKASFSLALQALLMIARDSSLAKMVYLPEELCML